MCIENANEQLLTKILVGLTQMRSKELDIAKTLYESKNDRSELLKPELLEWIFCLKEVAGDCDILFNRDNIYIYTHNWRELSTSRIIESFSMKLRHYAHSKIPLNDTKLLMIYVYVNLIDTIIAKIFKIVYVYEEFPQEFCDKDRLRILHLINSLILWLNNEYQQSNYNMFEIVKEKNDRT